MAKGCNPFWMEHEGYLRPIDSVESGRSPIAPCKRCPGTKMCCITKGIFKVTRDETGKLVQRSPLVALRCASGLAWKICFDCGADHAVDKKILELLHEFLDLHAIADSELEKYFPILQKSADKNEWSQEAERTATQLDHRLSVLESNMYLARKIAKNANPVISPPN